MNAKRQAAAILEANPERGHRGDFLKITVTMPAAMLGDLKSLGMERRGQGQKDTDVSSLIREAVTILLSKNS